MKGSVDQRTQILSKKAVTSAEFSVSPMMWQLFFFDPEKIRSNFTKT